MPPRAESSAATIVGDNCRMGPRSCDYMAYPAQLERGGPHTDDVHAIGRRDPWCRCRRKGPPTPCGVGRSGAAIHGAQGQERRPLRRRHAGQACDVHPRTASSTRRHRDLPGSDLQELAFETTLAVQYPDFPDPPQAVRIRGTSTSGRSASAVRSHGRASVVSPSGDHADMVSLTPRMMARQAIGMVTAIALPRATPLSAMAFIHEPSYV